VRISPQDGCLGYSPVECQTVSVGRPACALDCKKERRLWH
jgi:hypothetical protein